MTDKFFNESYTHRHDPRLDYQYGIHQAFKTGNLDAIYNILKLPYADPSFYNNYVLATAIQRNSSKVLSLLLEDDRIDPGMLPFNPIITSAEYGHVETLKVLLKDGRLDPGSNNNEAIKFASMANNVQVVEELLHNQRVNPNTGAFSLAVNNGHTQVLNILIGDPRVNPAEEHNLAIRLAARNGNYDIVNILLALKSRGVDPREIINGKNALDEALSIYSIPHFETAATILPHVESTIAMLYQVAKMGYLLYVKLLLDDCRIILTNNQLKSLTTMIKRRRYFPQFRHLTVYPLILSQAREDKKEVIMMLGKYNERGDR
jgi:ankyrin repeat protein